VVAQRIPLGTVREASMLWIALNGGECGVLVEIQKNRACLFFRHKYLPEGFRYTKRVTTAVRLAKKKQRKTDAT
jgi:uncharacterized membrane protein YsdA (DUF1294 family)